MTTILECSGLTKKYGSQKAVDNLNLKIERGRVYALLGPNGSGKSTFMKMAAGLIHPSSGELFIDGEPVGKTSKAHTVYMPTESYFYSYMTWKDAGRYFSDFYEDFQPEVYNQMLEEFSLTPKMKISKMSSGMMAKGKAALALSRDAKLIMLDEPLNGIDIIARDQILASIEKHCSPKKTFLVSSHLVDELERMTDYAVFMKNGGLVMSEKIDELTEHHGKTMTELYKEVYSDCVM